MLMRSGSILKKVRGRWLEVRIGNINVNKISIKISKSWWKVVISSKN